MIDSSCCEHRPESVLDKVEQDLKLDERRILAAKERAGQEKSYDHTEVWKKLGI